MSCPSFKKAAKACALSAAAAAVAQDTANNKTGPFTPAPVSGLMMWDEELMRARRQQQAHRVKQPGVTLTRFE